MPAFALQCKIFHSSSYNPQCKPRRIMAEVCKAIALPESGECRTHKPGLCIDLAIRQLRTIEGDPPDNNTTTTRPGGPSRRLPLFPDPPFKRATRDLGATWERAAGVDRAHVTNAG